MKTLILFVIYIFSFCSAEIFNETQILNLESELELNSLDFYKLKLR